MKEIYREKDVVGNIDSIKFSFLTSQEMEQMSHILVDSSNLYKTDEPGKPHPHGPLARQMVSF